MKIYDQNHDNPILVYRKENRFKRYPTSKKDQDALGSIKTFDNFVFSATIIPDSYGYRGHRDGVFFIDAHDGYEYRMTHKSTIGLLRAILIGKVTIESDGFTSLYTFRPMWGGDLSLEVFMGHKT